MVLNPEPHCVELVYAGQNVAVTETATSFENERQKVEISLVKSIEQNERFGIGNNGEMKNIKARSAGEQCPICSGARVLRGYNDFESKFPELAKEWSLKNEPLRPSVITAATHRKVIWQCKLGHEWTASVKSRTVNGTGCPYCSHNFVLPGFNDLASRFPEIAAEWSERNLPLTPDQVTAFKNIKVWWKCHLGHEWNTLISTRAGGSQCPYCMVVKAAEVASKGVSIYKYEP